MKPMEWLVPSDPVICKSCGYVMDKQRLGERCPACGVPAKMFEPDTERISAYRKLVFALSIHPILVHFPQAFTFTILVLSALCLLVSGSVRQLLLATLTTLSVCLPFTLILAVLAGLFDGKTRFRRLTTQLLKSKVAISSVFLLLACGNLYLALFASRSGGVLTGMLVLSIGCFICTIVLGLIGSRLMNAKFPG
jgi:uncharacterized membrane protein